MEGSVGRVQAQKERSTVFVGIISFVDNTEPKSIVFLFFLISSKFWANYREKERLLSS